MRRTGKKAARRNSTLRKGGKRGQCRHRQAHTLPVPPPMMIDALESRTMLCFTGTDLGPGTPALYQLSAFAGDPVIFQDMGPHGPALGAVPGSPLSAVPVLNSKPGAAATVYLDFNGDVAQSWGSYSVTTTPAYDTDGDITSFSSAELANIQQIWARMSDAYSPFDINVTTVDPGSIVNGQSVKVVFGGAGAWLGQQAGGVAYIGAFVNSAPNVVWVFPNNLGNGAPKYTADAAEHETGHAMGLYHQSQYSGTSKTAEYRQGDSLNAPIMGVSYYASRGKWSNGQSANGYNVYQDDMAVIAANPFGYSADDRGNTVGSADALDVSGNSVSASGIIEKTTDVDAFSFVTQAGPVSFTVSPAQYGGMLDATLKLEDLNGTVLVSADTSSLGETISTTLSSGSYRLLVGSHGVYGDVGQYTVSGTIVSDANSVAAPTNLTATAISGAVSLAWYDNAWNETGYVVERSDDGGTSWNSIGTPDADATAYVDSTASVGSTYKYRVHATGDSQDSANSNFATISVTPATPGGLAATSISASSIGLSWSDVSGESGYVIERSINNSTWSQVATPSADATSWSDTGLTAATKYYYRIKSASSAGNSATATAVNATTRPIAPTLTLAVASNAQITLTWMNVLGESGYRIERSQDGSSWATVSSAAANATTYANSGLTANTLYYYRVFATSAAGDSTAGSASGTTLLAAPSGLSASASGATIVDLEWNDSSDETGYRIEKTTDAKTWTLVTNTAADLTEYEIAGLVGGTTYTYRLRALNAGGASAPGASASVTTVPLTPTLTATAYSNTQINLSWTNVAGESAYMVERSADGSTDWSTIATPAGNVVTYSNTGLSANTVYYYRVTARNASGDSAASAIVSKRTLVTAPSGLTAAAASTTQVDLAWSDASGESGYAIDRSLNGSVWSSRATPGAGETSWSDTGLTAGTLYIYRIKANNPSGSSAPSANASATTITASTTLTVSAVSTTQVKLTWANITGETGYKIERSADGSSGWALIVTAAMNATTYTDSGLSANTVYYYRVTPTNASGDAAASEVKSTRTLLAAPTGFSATAVRTNEVDLAWTDLSGETGYVVERSLNGTAWSQVAVADPDAESYHNTGLVAGTAYIYRIRAANSGGNSAASATSTATTIPSAAAVTAAGVSATQINLAWTNVAGETGYRVEQSADGSSWTTIATRAVNVAALSVTGLSAGTLYYFRITPFNAAGNATGTTISKRTVLSAPTGFAATALSMTSIRLNWTDAGGDTGYKIERFNGRTWDLIATTAADATTYTNTGLTANKAYTYRIKAMNAAGDSAVSANTTATTPATAKVVK